MKKTTRTLFLLAAVLGLLVSPNVFAQEALLPATGDTPVDRLQANCDSIQSNLRRLHTSDALLRVNVGQVYNGISEKLMARLNSRLALNRIDSTEFVEITGRFEDARSEFSTSYTAYEVSLSNLTKIDCKTKPAAFYAALLTTRDARQKLSTIVQTLNENIQDYQVAVERLQQSLYGVKESRGEN